MQTSKAYFSAYSRAALVCLAAQMACHRLLTREERTRSHTTSFLTHLSLIPRARPHRTAGRLAARQTSVLTGVPSAGAGGGDFSKQPLPPCAVQWS